MKITNINKLSASLICKEDKFTMDNITNSVVTEKTVLPPFLEKVLIGLMLGDGNLSRSSITSNSRFEMSFGQKYKDYADSIGNLFIDYLPESSNSIPIKTVELTVKGKIYTNYRFKTASLSVFNKYHSLFYKIKEPYSQDNIENSINKFSEKEKVPRQSVRFIKIIPKNILELLDPIVLAYLIMSDGNFYKNRIRIYTNSYNKEEVEMLSNALNIRFGIYTAVLHDRKDQWIITIGSKQLDYLRKLISPYFHSSMLYRIGK